MSTYCGPLALFWGEQSIPCAPPGALVPVNLRPWLVLGLVFWAPVPQQPCHLLSTGGPPCTPTASPCTQRPHLAWHLGFLLGSTGNSCREFCGPPAGGEGTFSRGLSSHPPAWPRGCGLPAGWGCPGAPWMLGGAWVPGARQAPRNRLPPLPRSGEQSPGPALPACPSNSQAILSACAQMSAWPFLDPRVLSHLSISGLEH